MTVEEVVRQRVKEGLTMQLATCSNNQPWCCTVFYASDENLNIYWVSKPQTRHSLEIGQNSNVAAAIVAKGEVDGAKAGVQVEGSARMLGEQEQIEKAARLFVDKYNSGEKYYEDMVSGRSESKLYVLVPKMFGVFDSENFPGKGRVEWVM